MNDHSALGTVRDTLSTARDSLTDVHMITPLDAIVRQGRARRWRHWFTGLAGTAAVAALVIGLTGVIGSAPAHSTGTIRTAAFTLVSHANGTTTLTINPQVLLEPSVLQGDLEQDGIRAMVTVGSFCSSDPAPAGFLQVMSFPGSPADPGPVSAVVINPAGMPAGTELSFGIFQLATSQQTSLALIDTGSYTCTSTAPAGPPPDGVILLTRSAASGR
jgi:hypothetical protein